uniref:hypothetical protein n=1 Tax=Alloprevotella sp. TaxID=1872471 RepID=UPI003FEFB9A4
MKRFYNYFLSLLLLMVAGVTSAMAQAYQEGDLLETEEAVTSQDVLLMSTGGYHANEYLCGQGYATSVSKDCVYRFEKVDGTADGYNLYVLKRVATGEYFADYTVGDEEDTSTPPPFDGHMTKLTTDKAQAMKFTVVPGVENSDDPRASSAGGNQDYSRVGFVLATDHRADNAGANVQYLGHYSEPFYSIYNDTNYWLIFSVFQPTGKDKLLAYTTAYYGTDNADPALNYPAGTTAGYFKAELVNAAHAAWQEAYDILQVEGSYALTDEETNVLCDKIENTMTALTASDARFPLTAGRYFISDNRDTKLYLNATTVSNKDAWACSAYTVPEELDYSAASYLWDVEIAGQDSIYLKHLLTGLYVQSTMADDHHYALGKEPVALKLSAPTAGNRATFWITPKGNERACTNGAGWMLSWTDVNDAGNHFTFTAVDVDDAKVAQWAAEAKQNKLNETLAGLYTAADGLYKEGTSYKAAEGFTYTNDFTEEGKLVSPAEGEDDATKEANSHWYSNKKQGNEGTYEALVDNNPDTYFHSNWAEGGFTPSITKNHYLVATLDAPVSGDIMVKMAKRMRGDDFPLQVAIYGTNEFDKANANAAQWTFQGFSDISWADSVEISGKDGTKDKTLPDGVGAAYMHLDGSYKYIKIAATKTVYNLNPNDVNNKNGFLYNRGYFCLSEMNIWPTSGLVTTLSPEYQEAMTAAPEVYAALGEEINKAAAELAANKATQAQIDALNAAIEAFKNNLPVPSRVTDAYNAAKAFLDAANTNNMIGTELAQYSQESADALQTTLAKYETFDKIDLVSINAAVNDINAAFNAFKGSVRLPEAGKFYTIKSASTKVVAEADKNAQGYQGAIYNAIVYSTGNNKSNSLSDANSAVRFTFANHSSEVTADGETSLDAMMSSLSDSISLKDDASYVWKAETAQDGKMVLRNLATGMYLTGANGKLYQSTEPTPILGEGVKPNVFRFNLGEDAKGVTQYMNTKGATGTVVPWKDPADENSYWQFNELADDDYTTECFAIKGVSEGQFYACTFPVAITPDGNAVPYTVLGVNEAKDKLILAEVEDEVPAGTPVILLADVLTNNGEGTVGNLTVGCEDLASAKFVFEPKVGDGLCGVLCEPVEIAETCGHLANGKIVTGAYTVPCNGAYLANAAITAEKGKESIDLAKGVGDTLTGIDDAKVVVLPSVVNVYGINGQLIKKSVKAANATKNLPAGVYVIGGQKVLVK